MAQILAAVLQAGLESVLVAVEMVLESMARSGSDRHVRKVLARLNKPSTPKKAQTSLWLSEVSVADTAQYFLLRPTSLDGQEINYA